MSTEKKKPRYQCGCEAVLDEKRRSNHNWTVFVANCPEHGKPLDWTSVT